MNTFSGRSRRRAALALSAAMVSVIALAGCSETEEPVPAPGPATPAAPTLGSLGELRGLTMIDTSWESYRTAKVTSVTGRPDARAVDVTYEASDATCEKLAGFAQRRTKTQLQVTIVIGRQDDCESGTVRAATTSVPLTEPLGTLAPVASPYSEESVAIG